MSEASTALACVLLTLRCPPQSGSPLPQAEQLLQDGSAKYNGGDRMGALRLWEQALQQVGSLQDAAAGLPGCPGCAGPPAAARARLAASPPAVC